MTDKERADRLEAIAVWAIAEHIPFPSWEARYAMAAAQVRTMLKWDEGCEDARRRMLAGKNYLNDNPDLGAIASITIEKLKNREKEEKHDED